jgi:uncharacterized protein YidB (DUF937 family)
MDPLNLFGGIGGGEGQVDPAKLTAGVQEVFDSKGGVQGLVASLRAGGLGGAVDSWISTGSNEPVDPEKLGAALGPDTVNQLSAKTGVSVETLLPLLAAYLPMIIDYLTPDGEVPQRGQAGQGDIGDILGGILGGKG